MGLNDFVVAATASVLFFSSLLAIVKRSNTPMGYYFLATVFVFLSLLFIDELLSDNGLYAQETLLIVIVQPTLYLLGPSIFFAVKYLTSTKKKVPWSAITHLIPYLLLLLLYLYAYSENAFSSAKGNQEDDADSLLQLSILGFFFVQLTVYLVFSWKELRKHVRSLPLFASNIPMVEFRWLHHLLVGFVILFLGGLSELFFEIGSIRLFYSVFYLIGSTYIGIQLTLQKEVFPISKSQQEELTELIGEWRNAEANNQRQETKSTVKESNKGETNIERQGKDSGAEKKIIPDEKLNTAKVQLEELMETKKPYLDCDVSLPKLADLLGMSTYETSYLINHCFEENFYNFINRYRIKECKRMLTSNEGVKKGILEIAFDAGFNSKTAFYSSFKKSTGLSPKEYRINFAVSK